MSTPIVTIWTLCLRQSSCRAANSSALRSSNICSPNSSCQCGAPPSCECSPANPEWLCTLAWSSWVMRSIPPVPSELAERHVDRDGSPVFPRHPDRSEPARCLCHPEWSELTTPHCHPEWSELANGIEGSRPSEYRPEIPPL